MECDGRPNHCLLVVKVYIYIVLIYEIFSLKQHDTITFLDFWCTVKCAKTSIRLHYWYLNATFCQFQVIVPKLKTEPLGVVIVESGWGSMVPTVVLANMQPGGAAARCGQLNIGDQIISINGISLVGLPLSSCQNYIKVGQKDRLKIKKIAL